MAKNTVHGGPTDQTFPPLDPRVHGDRPTIDPVDAEEQREQAVEADAPEFAADISEQDPDLDDEEPVDEDGEPITDPPSDGPQSFLSATGDGEVVVGEKPPVDKSIDEVKAWVGDDYVKAERALEAEKAGKNRSGLVSYLQKIAATR